jgi:transposase
VSPCVSCGSTFGREAHPEGYGYSQFCELYRQWAKRLKPSMRLCHKGGEKVFVDYAGQTVPIVDPDSGEVRQAQIFVGVLEPRPAELDRRPRAHVLLLWWRT